VDAALGLLVGPEGRVPLGECRASAEHGHLLDQRDAQAVARRLHGGRQPGATPTDDHDVVAGIELVGDE